MTSILPDSSWLALIIGNSRLHWAWFIGEKLCYAWDTQHLPASVVQQLANCRTLDDFPLELPLYLIQDVNKLASCLPLYLASVVPSQTALWQTYPQVHVITLDQVPLRGIYPTLGIDRALALWGAGETWGLPVLVIDAGTAITLTGADADNGLFGGAILPGVNLQLQSLAQKTAIPLVPTSATLPERWALNTPEAIASGIFYTLLAGIKDFIEAWRQQFEISYVVLTGGDRALLLQYLQVQFPTTAAGIIADPHLIFWGMRSCKRLQEKEKELD